MSANILFDLLSLAVQAQYDWDKAPPVLLIGGCGVGKGEGFVKPIAKGLAKELFTIYLPRFDAAELNGYPYADHESKTMRHFAAHWAHKIQNEKGAENSLLFFDEASDAPRSTQAAAHGLLTDGIVGECSVKGCAMVLAMNPSTISTTGGTVSHAIGNRVLQLEATVDIHNVIRQVKSGRWDVNEVIPLPKGWTKTIPASMSMIGAFWERFPHLVQISESDLEKRGEDIWKPAHTLRSWNYFWVLRAAAIASGQEHLLHSIAMGTVGEPGVEYLAWEKDLEFGDPEEWLANPSAQPFPEEDDRAFAIVNAVINTIVMNNDAKRWLAGWKFLNHVHECGFTDIGALGAMTLGSKPVRTESGFKGNVGSLIKPYTKVLIETGIINLKGGAK